MKISYISDHFLHQYPGGAEIVDDYIMERLREEHEIEPINCADFNRQTADFYIVTNFSLLSEESKQFLLDKKYIIIEFDHKYLANRNPSLYPKRQAPDGDVINKDFYQNAQVVYCQSKGHAQLVYNHLQLSNLANFSSCFWKDEEIEVLRKHLDSKKTIEYAIVNHPSPVKGAKEGMAYLEERGLEYSLINPCYYADFVAALAKVKNYVFFPQHYESFNRMTVEAKVLGCKLIVNDDLGCLTEEAIANTSGLTLLEHIEKGRHKNIQDLKNVLLGEQTHRAYLVKNIPSLEV